MTYFIDPYKIPILTNKLPVPLLPSWMIWSIWRSRGRWWSKPERERTRDEAAFVHLHPLLYSNEERHWTKSLESNIVCNCRLNICLEDIGVICVRRKGDRGDTRIQPQTRSRFPWHLRHAARWHQICYSSKFETLIIRRIMNIEYGVKFCIFKKNRLFLTHL